MQHHASRWLGAVQADLEAFVDHVLPGGAPWPAARLFTESVGFPDAALAPIYGITAPAGGGRAKVTLDPRRRAGLLTLPALLTVHSGVTDASPIHRGVFVREQLLCEEMPSPPNADEIQPPAPDPKLTTRERFAVHRENPTCGSCHNLIDTIGFGFENYDVLGRYRTTENNRPIDATGKVVGGGEAACATPTSARTSAKTRFACSR